MGEERAPEGNGGDWRKERCLGKLCPPPTAAQGRAEDATVDRLHPAVGPAAREDGLCAGPRGPALPQRPHLHLLEATCVQSGGFRPVLPGPLGLCERSHEGPSQLCRWYRGRTTWALLVL